MGTGAHRLIVWSLELSTAASDVVTHCAYFSCVTSTALIIYYVISYALHAGGLFLFLALKICKDTPLLHFPPLARRALALTPFHIENQAGYHLCLAPHALNARLSTRLTHLPSVCA